MKLQLGIFKNIFNFNIIKICMLYYIVLIVSYIGFVFDIHKNINMFYAIFGGTGIHSCDLVLLIFNVMFFAIVIYKFINHESKEFAVNIAPRMKLSKWYIDKLIIVLLFVIFVKVLNFIIFFSLNYFLELKYFNIKFILDNIIFFLIICLVIFNIFVFYYNIVYLIAIGLILYIPNSYISLLTMLAVSLFIGSKIFNYKKILALVEFK